MTDIAYFENVDQAFLGRREGAALDENWIDLLLSRPSQELAGNVRTRWGLLRVGNVWMPTTVNDTEYDNSYVCSPYAGCVLYPRSEIDKLDGWLLSHSLRLLVSGMDLPLRMAQINRIVFVNNWLLSTNLYHDLSPEFIPETTRTLVDRYPSHAIAFRSLNVVTNRALLVQLERAGYLLAPSRQVYFFDGASGEYLQKWNNRVDAKHRAVSDYEIVSNENFDSTDAPRMEELYRKLYIEKYSVHNPQYTAEMLDEMRRREILSLWGLRGPSGRLDGIVGSFVRANVMTVPIVGYDTSLSKKLGLYRLLMAIVLGEAANRKVLLNLSSGAAGFKRLRGGIPSLEYTAVYCKHLARSRRIAWRGLAWLLENVGAPILKKYQL